MSDELIKRLRIRAKQYMKSGLHDQASMLTEAADALSRPAPVQVSMPDGWKLERNGEAIIVGKHGVGGCVVKQRPTESREIPESILWMLADALLAAAPTPAPVATEAVAQGGVVDAEKVMGLVLRYGQEKQAFGATGDTERGITADELRAQIRAMLTPATCKSSLQVVGWIPVGERLPETNHPVIGLWWEGTDEGHPEVLYYEGDDVWFDINGMSAAPDYWLPIPPPPAIANQEEGK